MRVSRGYDLTARGSTDLIAEVLSFSFDEKFVYIENVRLRDLRDFFSSTILRLI